MIFRIFKRNLMNNVFNVHLTLILMMLGISFTTKNFKFLSTSYSLALVQPVVFISLSLLLSEDDQNDKKMDEVLCPMTDTLIKIQFGTLYVFIAFTSVFRYCHNPSPSPKSKVKSQKDLEWLYSALPPTTTTTKTFLSNQTSNWAQIFTVDSPDQD